MAARAIASLSLSFGLVSIPVKLYSATESSAAIRFKLMGREGLRVRQQYVVDADRPMEEADVDTDVPAKDEPRAAPRLQSRPLRAVSESAEERAPPQGPAIVARADMLKGYEFEKGRFVLFTADELKALQEGARHTIDIVAFIPQHSVDPVYYDKAYFLAPDKRGAKTYSLLHAAMRKSGRCALAKWAWRSKEYVVEVRPAEGGMVLQQLLYADEVRSIGDLDIERVDVGQNELQLALQLIEQISADAYDPSQFVDEEKQRILAAIEQKVAGRKIVAAAPRETSSAQVIDLMEALRASLRTTKPAARAGKAAAATPGTGAPGPRKPARRAVRPAEPAARSKTPARK
jgi:DNA end-binding protein Ku